MDKGLCCEPKQLSVLHCIKVCEAQCGQTAHIKEGIFLSWLLQNDVEKVVVVILDKEHHPVERFVFEITQPPLLSIR